MEEHMTLWQSIERSLYKGFPISIMISAVMAVVVHQYISDQQEPTLLFIAGLIICSLHDALIGVAMYRAQDIDPEDDES
jgi:hypothetical protein